jgi:UDPglucose 6-dehydrogenase
VQQGVHVRAHDPAARALPDDLRAVTRAGSPEDAATGADALVVATEWPDYRLIDPDILATAMSGRVVVDGNRFLGNTIGRDARFRLVSVGAAHVGDGGS